MKNKTKAKIIRWLLSDSEITAFTNALWHRANEPINPLMRQESFVYDQRIRDICKEYAMML